MTNNTIPNVPRELLERVIMSTYMYWPDAPLIKEIRALLSAPSPAGVDGLSVVAYRVSLPGEPELGTWLDEDAENEPQMCLHEPLCRLSDAQAIIDGLREEVERSQRFAAGHVLTNERISANLHAVESERDQQAQRIGELEGLLRESGKTIHKLQAEQPTPARIARYLDAMRGQIDALLSAGKEGE